MTEEAAATWDMSRLGLGLVLLAAGIFVLVDIALVSTISAVVIGGAVIVAGVAAALESLARPGWSGAIRRLALAILYIAFGLSLILHPSFQAVFLKTALTGALIVSGGLRVWMALFNWATYRWLIVSGVIGIVGGAAILFWKPAPGIGFIAAMLGADLLTHGVGWILIGWKKGGAPGRMASAPL